MNGFVEIIEGAKGSGKSLFFAERCYEHLEWGGYAFTNVEMRPDAIAERMATRGFKFDPERLVQLTGEQVLNFDKYIARGTAKSLVMVGIDEAHLEGMSSQDWRSVPRDLDDINALARKLDLHLSYITQDRNNVPIGFRRQTDEIWVCRNLAQYKFWGVIPCPIPLMFRGHFDSRGKHQKPMHMHTDVLWRPSWAFGLYNSDALLGRAAGRIATMRSVEGKPLERIPKKTIVRAPDSGWPMYITAAVTCAISFVS